MRTILLFLLLAGCTSLPERSISIAETLATDYKNIYSRKVTRKTANINVGENRMTPPNLSDLKILESALDVINRNKKYPRLVREPYETELSSVESFPKWVQSSFDTMVEVAFGGEKILGLVRCKSCLALSNIEDQVIAVDESFLKYLDSNYDLPEKSDFLQGLFAHEISHYLISLYTHLYSSEHLTPLGYYDMADIRYARPSNNVNHRHAEVDLMAQVLLKKSQSSTDITDALMVVAEHIKERTGEESRSLAARIKILKAFLK